MQETRNCFQTLTFAASQQGGHRQVTMDEIKNNNCNASEKRGTKDTDHNAPNADLPVQILSVLRKQQDGNDQYEVSPMPVSGAHASNTTAPAFFNTLKSGYYVSPIPPTPTTDEIICSDQTPSSCISRDTTTLAALYQSSRRSRRDSPMPTPTNYTAAKSSSISSRRGFLPPPPLASASPKPVLSSTTMNAPSSLNEDCSALVGSLTDSSHVHPMRDDERLKVQATQVYPHVPSAALHNNISAHDSWYLTPLVQTKPTVSMPEYEFTPNKTMDMHLLDLANASSINMRTDQVSKLRSRTLETSEDLVHQTKKPRRNDVASEVFERPLMTCMHNKSVSDRRVEESIESLLALSTNEHSSTQQVTAEQGSQQEDGTSDKQHKIIRRKVQRLSKLHCCQII